jgi:hypothetical protein
VDIEQHRQHFALSLLADWSYRVSFVYDMFRLPQCFPMKQGAAERRVAAMDGERVRASARDGARSRAVRDSRHLPISKMHDTVNFVNFTGKKPVFSAPAISGEDDLKAAHIRLLARVHRSACGLPADCASLARGFSGDGK